MNQFGFDRRVEAFDNSVVPTIAFATHAAPDAVITEKPSVRAMLSTFVGLAYFHRHAGASGLISYFQRFAATESEAITGIAASSALQAVAPVVLPVAPSVSLVGTGQISNGFLIMSGKLYNETDKDIPCSTKNFLLIADGTSDEPNEITGGLDLLIDPSGCHTDTIPPHTFTRWVMSFSRNSIGPVTIRYKNADAEASMSGNLVNTSVGSAYNSSAEVSFDAYVNGVIEDDGKSQGSHGGSFDVRKDSGEIFSCGMMYDDFKINGRPMTWASFNQIVDKRMRVTTTSTDSDGDCTAANSI
jgi:hypothetical protein